MKNSIGSFTAKAAAFLLAFGCAVSAWGATTQVATSAALTDAVSAASPGDTIQLTADVTLSATLEITKSITLDLNGKTLSKTLASTTDTTPVIKALSGTVEIKNGSITYDHSAFTGTGAVSKPSVLFVGMNMSNGVYSYGDCNLTLNGVNASVTFPSGKASMTMVYVESGRLNVVDSNLSATTGASNTKTQYMIYTTAHASAMVDPYVSISGTTTIDTNGKPGIHAIWLQGSKDTLVISGDDVTINADATWKPNSYSTSYAYAVNNQSGATCTIEGGKFAGKVWATKGTITVYGGTFSYPQGTSGQKNKFTLAEGVEYVENTDPATKDAYPYVAAVPAPSVAQIVTNNGATTNKYESLAAAVAAASAGDTITMLADDNVSLTDGSRLTIDKSLTITGPVAANGEPLYTIYGKSDATGSNNIYIDGSGTVTLSNLKIKDFGNNKGTDGSHAPVYVASSFTGTVNLDNLYISDFNRGGVFLYGGTFNVTDCYIDCANSRSGAFTKGIEIKGSATGSITDTVICNMERSSSDYAVAGIEVYGSGSVHVEGCVISSDEGSHTSATKATYGIVSGRVGEHDPSGGSLEVVDCIISVTGASVCVGDNEEFGATNDYSITINGGSYEGYVLVYNQTSSITIEDGDFSGGLYSDPGTITVNGGSFDGVLDADPGAIVVKDGTFANFSTYVTTGGSISISGGQFDAPVPEEYCASGYIPSAQDAETGLYSVKAGTYVAQIGDVKYETFAEAIAAAEAMSPVPAITVIDATAEQTNDGWMFSQDGQRLVRKVAMVTTNVDNYATTNYYASAAEAFSAAESAVANKSGTGTSYAYVTLLADDTLPGDATTVLKSNHGRTDRRYIDLNGHTLTAPKGISLEYKSGGFQVYLQDGSAAQTGRVVNPTADDPEAFVFTVGSSVSLTVEGGAIVAKGEGTALKTTGGGSITLKGGSVTADPAGRALNAAGTNSITAEADSSVSVTGTLGAPTGVLTLRGGTFTANAANGELFDIGETGSVAVSGGSFSSAVPAQCIATGYKDAGQIAVVPGYYTVTKEVYTITFLDENDNVIISGQLEYNALYSTLPVPAIPVKVSDDPAFYYKGAWVPSASTSTRATGNATHKLTYTQGKYGFQYGDGLYTNSLANAYKAVADGGTVTVLTNAFALTSTTLNLAKDVTIDLNGSTLSMNNTGMLTVSGEGTKVTFANGTIKYGSGTTARDAFVKAAASADVAFKDVEMQGADPYTTAVLATGEGSSATFDGACIISMPEGKQAVTAANGATVAISGGLYSTEVPVAYCAADYKPADGTVEHDGKNYYTVTLKRVFSASDMEASSETEAGGIVTVANGVVSTALSGVSDIRFIRAYSADGFVTLRTSDASNTFALPAGFGTVTKVVAYCGENVTATAGAVPSLFPRVDRTAEKPCAAGSFAVKSGVYYSLEVNGVRTALYDNKPVAPAEDGDSLNYSVPVSPNPWGVVKFRIIVSDEPLSAGE